MNRYCEAIAAVIKGFTRPSSYFTFTFFELHKELTERLSGVPDKNTSWISRTMKKPTMDTLGAWSINKLTKFIEGDDPSPETETDDAGFKTSPTNGSTRAIGPFSHYSEISSSSTSQLPSPTGSIKSYTLPSAPLRTGSAMSTRTGAVPAIPQIDRAASAIDHLGPTRTMSPAASAPRAVLSTGPSAASLIGNTHQLPSTLHPPKPTSHTTSVDGTSRAGGWWDSLRNGSAKSDHATPVGTASRVNGNEVDNHTPEEGNFISLMDAWSPGSSPHPNISPVPSHPTHQLGDDEEDLGFGNKAHQKKKGDEDSSKPDHDTAKNERSGGIKKTTESPNDEKPKAPGWSI